MLMLIPTSSNAQFTLSAEIRPRLEINHGYRSLFPADAKPGVIFTQRSRLTFGYEHEIFTTKISIQDVRAWGEEKQLGDVAGVSLHEAWGEVRACENFSARIGRQELVYDDHRLFGSVNWLQQARSHDAVVLKFHKGSWKLDAGAAYNNDKFSTTRMPYTMGAYRALAYGWLNKNFNDKVKLSVIGIANGVENTTEEVIYFTGTVGPHLTFKKEGFSGSATYYYQFGKTTANQKVSVMLAAFSAKYTVKKTGIGVGFDYASGNDALGSGSKDMRFNSLYSTAHKFFGFMDYFLNLPVHSAGGGLMDVQLKLNTKIGEKTSLLFHGHYFLSGANVETAPGPGMALDKGLGGEIDAVFSYNIHPMVNFKTGWSVMIPTSSLEVVNGSTKGQFNTWVWTMMTFKPVMFKSKEKEKETASINSPL